MILFLTLIYVALLALMVKLGVIRLTLPWKLSPLIVIVALNLGLFVPMQFWAPAGPALIVQYTVPIVPNVAGEVIEIPVEPNQPLAKGEVLFRIDPEPYEAALDQVSAQLALAQIERDNSRKLRATNAISQIQLDRDEARVRQLQASQRAAQYNLQETTVRAPADGYVTNLALRPGARVAALPLSPAMAFVETDQRFLVTQVLQSYLRYIEPGMPAEVTFKIHPGQVFSAEVEYVIKANSQGQVAVGGTLVAPRDVQALPYAVRLRFDDDAVLSRLPAGAVGSAAIYTNNGRVTHVIRKVMVRMDAFMNYIIPT